MASKFLEIYDDIDLNYVFGTLDIDFKKVTSKSLDNFDTFKMLSDWIRANLLIDFDPMIEQKLESDF